MAQHGPRGQRSHRQGDSSTPRVPTSSTSRPSAARNEAGGERGVYKSEDGGESWQRSLFAGERVAIIDLVLDPFDPERLWAAAWDRAGKGSQRRLSHDMAMAESNWELLEAGCSTGGGCRPRRDRRRGLGSGGDLRLDGRSLAARQRALRRGRRALSLDDGGDSWARTSDGLRRHLRGLGLLRRDGLARRRRGGLRLRHAPDVSLATAARASSAAASEVFRLLDHPGKGMHLDMHDLWIDPENPDRILLGTDGGLYVSMDRARSWLHLNNLPIAEFYTVFLDEEQPFRVWGGTQDNASLVAPSTAELVDTRSDDWRSSAVLSSVEGAGVLPPDHRSNRGLPARTLLICAREACDEPAPERQPSGLPRTRRHGGGNLDAVR